MTRLPGDPVIPFLNDPSLMAIRQDHERLRYMVEHDLAQLRFYFDQLDDGAGGRYQPAVTTTIIPARAGITPGGPVSVQRKRIGSSGTFEDDGAPVDVYSWVRSDSADPADETQGELWISIAQDEYGTWWFAGQDCTDTPATVQNADASSDLIVSTTPQVIPGTALTITHPGVFNYAFACKLEIVGIPGNQAWDVTVGAYTVTGGDLLFTRDLAGGGDPGYDPVLNGSGSFEILEADVGDTLALAASRLTTTGVITALAAGTAHQLTGPIK